MSIGGFLQKWLNDRKLTRRWQVAESMKRVNEGRSAVRNKEDRFHLTPRDEELVEGSRKQSTPVAGGEDQ